MAWLAHVRTRRASADADIASPRSALAARGRCIPRLRLESAEAGLLGRTLLRLVPSSAGATLGEHRISQNDIVQVRRMKGDGAVLCEGVVYRLYDAAIVVAAEDPPDGEMNVPLRVVKLANEVTHTRLRQVRGCKRERCCACAAKLTECRNHRGACPPAYLRPALYGSIASAWRARRTARASLVISCA